MNIRVEKGRSASTGCGYGLNSKAGHIGGSPDGHSVALYYYLMDAEKFAFDPIATVLCSAKAIVPKRSMPCWLIGISLKMSLGPSRISNPLAEHPTRDIRAMR